MLTGIKNTSASLRFFPEHKTLNSSSGNASTKSNVSFFPKNQNRNHTTFGCPSSRLRLAQDKLRFDRMTKKNKQQTINSELFSRIHLPSANVPLFPKVKIQTTRLPIAGFLFQKNLKVNFHHFLKQKTHLAFADGFVFIVVPPGIEPGTHGFSVRCSTN